VIVAIVLMLALGWIWVFILPVALVVAIGWWIVAVLSQGKTPGQSLRRVHHTELLGPGGPDDPDASRR
jgi:hypothetical protein